MDGAIVVDKPPGWTSHDAVNRMRRLAQTRRVGHLGTLDPAATGVLPLVIGRATRLAQFYMRSDKVYDAVIRFGQSTSTYDAEGEPTSPALEPALDREEIERIIAGFRGVIRQTPPPISAKKIGGIPAYRLARRNLAVDLQPVEVSVFSFDLRGIEGPEIRVEVHCSAGTYLRSIAHEMGRALGCGAYLKSLRRLASGHFNLEQARTLDELGALAAEGRLGEALVPAARLLPDFPSEPVDPVTATQIRQGRDFRVSPFRVHKGARYVKAIGPGGDLLAVGEARLPSVYHPILVL
jgi:tRNA pseudouridine55 synthase